MRKKWQKLASLLLACVLLTGLSACGGAASIDGGGNEYEEEIDVKRTQLFIQNFEGGFGSDWLVAAKTRYEEIHKDDVYEEGKKGVQIYLDPQKIGVESYASSVRDSRNEIYFSEHAYYRSLMNAFSEGLFADITDAVTGDLSIYGDPVGSTIESKLNEEQRNYFGINEGGQIHYYGIPHYSGYAGLVYNVDLFEKENYYFTANPESDALEDQFIYSKTETKSAGPDGIMGTYDDGLPATYKQFFQLCDWISQANQIPVLWSGKHHADYLNHLITSLATDYEGKEQFMINFNLDDTATSLGTVNGNQFVKDADPTEITLANGYETSRQAGKYYAIDFLEKLIKGKNGKYHNASAFNSAHTHMDAQDDFLYAGNDGKTPKTAMLVEGIWWQNEARQTFTDMVNDMGNSYSKYNRNFALMPLPKVDEDHLGGVTLYDHIFSICFVKANIASWKKDLALDFIKFLHTDESLIEFTQITDAPKAFNYTMTEEQKASLSTFARSVVEMKERADIVYPISQNATYLNNQSFFASIFYSEVGGIEYKAPSLVFSNKNLTATAKDYFEGIYTYKIRNWVG